MAGRSRSAVRGRKRRDARRPVETRRRIDQLARIGVRRVGEQVLGLADLDDAPAIHHRRRLANMGDHGEIVADQEKGDARLALRSLIRFNAWACTETSSADTGSSATTSFGRVISARAMAMRWRWPPENSCGYLAASAARRPTASSDVRRRARVARPCSLRPAPPAARRRSSRHAGAGRASHRGPGTPSACARASRATRVAASRTANAPRASRRPKSGVSSASAMRARVDLPEPDSPTIPNERPCRMAKLTPASAGRAALRANGPAPGRR